MHVAPYGHTVACTPISTRWGYGWDVLDIPDSVLLWYDMCYPYLKGCKMDKPHLPRTKTQKGRAWATATLVICGAYSIWANVTSGAFLRDSIITSVAPPVVLFLTVHLISYLNPNKRLHVWLGYVGLGVVSLVAFGVSGYHIVEKTMESGQDWRVALGYPFIVDVPMLISAVILVQKVSMTQNGQSVAKPAVMVQTPQVATKAASPAKKTAPAKATKAATPAKATKAAKATVPAFKAPIPDIKDDVLEREMLSA